jgi:hypothetical protein
LQEQWGESVMLNYKNKKGLSHPMRKAFSFSGSLNMYLQSELNKKQ